MKAFPCIDDLRERARRNVPNMFFDYAEAGSYNEETLRANRADMERIKLRQRVLVNVDQRSTATTILGEPVPMPLALGPIGLGGMMHGDGEIMACRAAQRPAFPTRCPLCRSIRSRTWPARSRSRSGFSSTSCATAVSSAS